MLLDFNMVRFEFGNTDEMKSATRLTHSILTIGLFASAAFGQSGGSTSAFARGCEQMMHKNFSTAITSFTEAISDEPNDVNAYFRRGQSFFCVGNYKEALVDFDRALAKGALDYNVYLWKGTAYAKLDNGELSVFNYEKAMRLNPKLVEPFKSTAPKTVDSSSPEPSSLEARIETVRTAAMNLASSKIAGTPDAHENVSGTAKKSTLSLGSSERAVDAYKTAARRIAENEIGYFRLGTTYSGLLNLSGAVIPLSGECGKVEWIESVQKGKPYFSLKEPRKDVRELDAQITLHPQDAILYFQRALAYQQLGKATETLNDLNRAIELDGTNSNYFLARAFHYHSLKNMEAAATEIRRAQDVDPVVPSDLSFPADRERIDKSSSLLRRISSDKL